MIRNFFKIAWRRLRREKHYSLLNIAGLTAGLLFVLLLAVYVHDEYRVNAGLRNLDRQYILQSHYQKEGLGIPLTSIGALAKAAHEQYPHLIANYYRFDGINCIVSSGEKVFEESGAIGDASLLEMYGFELHEGDPKLALQQPFTVVITEDAALRMFGKTQVIGELLGIRNFSGEKKDFMITGVLKDQGNNSVINLLSDGGNTIFLPLESADYFGRGFDNWYNPYIASYIELTPGTTGDQAVQALQQLIRDHADPQYAEALTPVLNPLKNYYLDSGQQPLRKKLDFLIIIGVFVLLLAIINYISITVSQSIGRLKEFGIRRITGSSPLQLAASTLLESTLMVGIASGLALGLYPLMAPVYTAVFGKAPASLLQLPGAFLISFVIGTLLLGLLAGAYPAFKLSGTPFIHSVKSGLAGTQEKQLTRKALVTMQFTVSIGLFIASLVVFRQTDLFFGQDIGYDKDRLITVQVPRDWSPEGVEKMQRIRQTLSALSEVENITLSYEIPTIGGSNMLSMQIGENDNPVVSSLITVDQHYADTYKIPLTAGHFFSPGPDADSPDNGVVINKTAASALGFREPREAVGQSIRLNGNFPTTVTGITEDFVLLSMHQQIMPLVYIKLNKNSLYRYFSIRLNDQQEISKTLRNLEDTWKTMMPDTPFAYSFMDDLLKKNYQNELQTKSALSAATAMALLMVLIGQIGLLSLSLRQRIKEIGIRQVLGAGFGDLVGVFGRQYAWIFILATLIALPVSYYFLHNWLSGYHFRTDLHDAILLLPVGGLAALAAGVIGLMVYQTMSTNPVDSLRDE